MIALVWQDKKLYSPLPMNTTKESSSVLERRSIHFECFIGRTFNQYESENEMKIKNLQTMIQIVTKGFPRELSLREKVHLLGELDAIVSLVSRESVNSENADKANFVYYGYTLSNAVLRLSLEVAREQADMLSKMNSSAQRTIDHSRAQFNIHLRQQGEENIS